MCAPPLTARDLCGLGGFFPFARLCRLEHSMHNSFGRHRMLKRRFGRFLFVQRIQKICDLMNKPMFEANRQAWYPPVGHVRMISVRDMDRSPAAKGTFIPVIEPLQPMQIMEIPGERAVFAV